MALRKVDFDMNELRQKISQLQAAQSDGSQANTTEIAKSYRCMMCRDEEGYFIKVPQLMTVKGEQVEVLMDHWEACSCKQNRQVERVSKSSKITFEFQQKTFDSFDLADRPEAVRSAYHCARQYYITFNKVREERQNSIALLGRPGCGKTHLLMAVANELMRQAIHVLYFPWVEGFNEIKDDLSLTEERINRMQKVDVLYIDDMFKGRKEPTQFQLEQMFAVINYRYMEKKPILISSERDIDEICDFDEGLGSRINEMCRDFRVILKGGRELNFRLREETA